MQFDKILQYLVHYNKKRQSQLNDSAPVFQLSYCLSLHRMSRQDFRSSPDLLSGE